MIVEYWVTLDTDGYLYGVFPYPAYQAGDRPAGAVQVTEEQLHELTVHGKRLVSGSIEEMSLDKKKALGKKEVDEFSDGVRMTYVSGGVTSLKEYENAYQEAVGYINAGYTGDIPASVQSDMDYSGRTSTQAADFIKATGDYYNYAIGLIRAARLTGKKNVSDSTTFAEVDTAVSNAIAALSALSAPF